MVRNIKYDHNKVVTGTQDGTKQVSKNEWNDGHDEAGMFGWGTVSTLTIATGAITPINGMHKIDGEGAAADDLTNITNTETNEFDELWLLGGAQTITVKNSGNITTLSGNDLTLSTNVPTKIIRIGTNWFEVGGSGSGVFSDNVFAIQDEVDATKEWDSSVGGATTSTKTTLTFLQTANRTITFFDATDTLVGKATTDIFTNKSYDLGGTGNVLTGSVSEFNTALQADTFFFISNNISNMATSTSAQFDAANSDGTFFLNADNISAMATSTKAQFNTANSEDTFGYLGTAQTWTLANTFAEVIQTGRHQLDKGTDEPSATELTLATDGNVFDITGTTTINTISVTNWQAGSVIHLQFDGVLTVTHNSGGTNDILLGDQANMTTAVGDVLTLFNNGTDWVEISRSVVSAGGGSDTPWTVNHDFDTFFYDMQNQTAPANPATDNGRYYQKVIDANNDGLFVKIKKNGGFVEVQIA